MSDNIKYYYLKLKDNFFDSEEMKILESQKNGIEYQNLYLKLCLLSLKSEGRLIFKDYLPYDVQMLSTVLRINIDTVKTGLEIFVKMGLIDVMDTGLIFMTDIQSLIGTSSSEADRKKAYREKINECKKTNDGQTSGQMSPEIEKEIKLKIELEKESVKREISSEIIILTQKLYDSLVKPTRWNKKPPDLNEWAIQLDRLNRLDGISYELIGAVIEFIARYDKWKWREIIQSGEGFRKNFDQIEKQMKKNRVQTSEDMKNDVDYYEKKIQELKK